MDIYISLAKNERVTYYRPSLSITFICKVIYMSLTCSAEERVSQQKQKRFCDSESTMQGNHLNEKFVENIFNKPSHPNQKS